MSRRLGMLGVFLVFLVAVSSLNGCVRPRDYFVTVSDPDRGGAYQNLAIPAGFFCPDCEAFKGRVDLVGSPLDRAKTGAADSIMERSGDPIRSWDKVGKTRTVKLKLAALSLNSREPITVNSKKGPQQWHVHVGLSDARVPSGSATATKTHANGGTFDSTFYVQPLLTFTSAQDPNRILVLDTAGVSDPFKLSAKAAPFVIKRSSKQSVVATRGSSFTAALRQTDPNRFDSQIVVPFLHHGLHYEHPVIPVELPVFPGW